MTENTKSLTPAKAQREKALADDRRNILAMTPEKALDAVAEHPYPVTLVQSFAEEDLYLLVHTIGPDDALPIIGLASNEQWEYLLDNDTWSRDRIDLQAMTQWLDRLLKADADRFTHWIIHQKSDELEYYLFHNIEVAVREHDQDPSDFGEDFFSEDQTHFVRLRKIDPALQTGKQYEEERDILVTDLLKRLAVYDYPKYVALLLESATIVPSEAEEELYRLRNVRLAEKGFIPHDEAVGVYQPLGVQDLMKRGRKPDEAGGRRLEAYPAPVVHGAAREGDNLFARALGSIQDEAVYQRLQSEFAGLCNQVIAADQIAVRQKETLNQVVARVSDCISLGLEKIALETGEKTPQADISPIQNQIENRIQNHMLADLFRVGYGCALELKWKAERWQKSAWFTQEGLPLSFWGETGLGILGGLLLKKPLRYNPAGKDSFYEAFTRLDQIKAADQALSDLMGFDELLARMPMKLGPGRSQGLLTYQNLLLTLWAHHFLGRAEADIQPLTLDQFRRLFKHLWKADAESPTIKDDVKESFLNWLARNTGLATFEITERMGPALEGLFKAIEAELGHVQDRYLDPRFIHLFIIADDPS